MNYLFTSESVSEGHPDKICDQISDVILDAYLKIDPNSRVACECYATTGMILVGGEITSNASIDIEPIIRNKIKDIGYDNTELGFDYKSLAIINTIHKQSADIDQGVSGKGLEEFKGEQGAGDQGIMFGYACNETEQLMPAPIMYSHLILEYAAKLRKSGLIKWLRPDAKSQVTVLYENGKPKMIDTIVVSHQHDSNISYDEVKDTIINNIIKPSLSSVNLITDKTKYFINPTGKFIIGGPAGDTGLTGRKIIVDTYGGMGHHGGGAFSGKDPSKVDRSASYIARYIAKNIVAAKIADKCEIQLSYAFGVPFPISVYINTFNTGKISDNEISKIVQNNLDLSPSGIIKTLDLKKPIYEKTASYGHFGRNIFNWEKIDRKLV